MKEIKMFSYDVVVRPIQNPRGKTMAFANVIIDGVLEVCGFKVIEGSNGLFVSAPQTKSNKQDENGRDIWYNDVRFLDGKTNEDDWRTPLEDEVFKAILAKYEEVKGHGARGSAASAQAESGGQGGAGGKPAVPAGAGNNPLW
jgi:DNA-binding cell septation regulator SpoVG